MVNGSLPKSKPRSRGTSDNGLDRREWAAQIAAGRAMQPRLQCDERRSLKF
jgi:hypothetical protein